VTFSEEFGVSAQIRFKAVATAVVAAVALAGTPASAQTPSSDLSKYPMILTFHLSGERGRPNETVLDWYVRGTGDSCPAKLRTALKNAGAPVFLRDGASVFNLNGTLRDDSDVAGKGVDLNSVSEIEFRIQPWWPALSIRNTSHFANVMFSEPWRKLQRKEIAGGGLSAISWGYVRAALVNADLKPLVRPEELKEDGIENSWMEPNRSWLVARRQPPSDGDGTTNMGQMCETFGDLIGDLCRPRRTPTNWRGFATSHQLGGSQVKKTSFVSLTTANILVDEMRFENGKAVPPSIVAAAQNLLDQVAAECSKANVTEELSELRALQASQTLNPVDLDAFQSRRRSVIEKFASKLELNMFDEIQALK
jgi:hypothetical protein